MSTLVFDRAAGAATATASQFVTAATLGAAAVGAAAAASVVAAGYEGYKLYHELPAVQDAKAREEAANRAQKGVSESGAKAAEAVPAAGGGGAKVPPKPPTTTAAPAEPSKKQGGGPNVPQEIPLEKLRSPKGEVARDARYQSVVEGVAAGETPPIEVEPSSGGTFRIQEGVRRAVSARELGLKSIRAIVRRATAGGPKTIPLKDVRLK